jgi:hypothetical protein
MPTTGYRQQVGGARARLVTDSKELAQPVRNMPMTRVDTAALFAAIAALLNRAMCTAWCD